MNDRELEKRVKDARLVSRFPYVVYGLLVLFFFLRENSFFYRVFAVGTSIGYVPVLMCFVISFTMVLSARKDGARGTADVFIRSGLFFIIGLLHYAVYGFVLQGA